MLMAALKRGDVWLLAALARIDMQSALVATLQPGSPDHLSASSALVILQDSLAALLESQDLATRKVFDEQLPG